MIAKMSKKSRLLKTISFLLVFAFSFYSVSYAIPSPLTAKDFTATQTAGAEISVPNVSVDDIGIAIDSGTIKSKYSGSTGKVIVHIQDAHCNFEAQSNINKILDQVTKENGIDMISVEGAEGIVDTAWFRAFPDAEIRKEVATYFMKKGEITGAEFFSINSDYTGNIFGAETREYYIENLKAFTDVYSYKSQIETYLKDTRTITTRLKSIVYSPKLRDLDSKIRAFKEKDKDTELSKYAEYLQKTAETNNVNIKEYEDSIVINGQVFGKEIKQQRADFKEVILKKGHETVIDE
ncbi:MAG: hypothetical protein KJ983_05150, partial [Candidatus Omnitrophica bacterium]|nr:hypothetical protein [Candidatus Omnitrophota bacterium]